MERLVLVHGSVVGARGTWAAQRPLADRFELVVVERPGFPPNPPVDRVDFEHDAALVADLLAPGDHLVGHSYGGVISLLAAVGESDRLRSLTVIEPPATRVAARRSRGRLLRRGGRSRSTRPARPTSPSVPAPLPRGRRLGFRAALPAPARARPGRAGADRRARPVGGGHPSRLARRRILPEARGVRSTPPGVRRDLRRPRAASCLPSAPCSRATATWSSGTPSSTTSSPTSSSGRPS